MNVATVAFLFSDPNIDSFIVEISLGAIGVTALFLLIILLATFDSKIGHGTPAREPDQSCPHCGKSVYSRPRKGGA